MATDQPMDPNSDGVAKSAQTAAVARKPWLPLNPESALSKFALKNGLGHPQTPEFEFAFGREAYLGQVYSLGIVYVKKGDWSNCKWARKPEGL